MSWQTVGLWHMLTAWLRDPQRRKQVAWRIVEAWAGVVAVWFFGWWGLVAAPLAEWLVYEFILELWGVAGPYWERSPAEGTTFKEW